MDDIKNEFRHLGYSKEDEYFYRKNMELLARLRMESDLAKKKLAEEHALREYWMRCPKCGTAMTEQSLEELVVVDTCSSCRGVYFDKGELDILLKAEHSPFHRIYESTTRSKRLGGYMKKLLLIASWIVVGAFAAAGNQANQPPQSGHDMGQVQMMKECPISLPGVEVAVADTSNGIMVTFTAAAQNVAELQRRVERWANMHRLMAETPKFQDHMIAGEVKYTAMPNGAHLTLTPTNPARLEEFRMQVRTHVEQMTKGQCSMMENMMKNMMRRMNEPDSKPNGEENKPNHGAHHPSERDIRSPKDV